jgi:hypothetical protein
MPFTVDEFRDLVRILEQQPEWREELRRLILTEELLALPQIVRELAEAQRRTEQRLDQLVGQIGTLTEVQQRLVEDVGQLKGQGLEVRYERFAPAYFRPIILRAHTLSPDERAALIEGAAERGQLSDQEARDLLLTDLLVRGRRREDQHEVYLAVEISWGIGHDDVRRAAERSALLARTGVETIPVVAGDWAPHEVQAHAQADGVWLVTDGHVVPPSAA